MTISKDDASRALDEIAQAQGRMRETTAYAAAGPFLIFWGLAWLIADVGVSLAPLPIAQWIWPVVSIVFVAISVAAGIRQGRRRAAAIGTRTAARAEAAEGWRHFWSGAAIFAFLFTLFLVTAPLDDKQVHTIFGLFFGFAYLVVGLWGGWRLVALGALLAALSLVGFYVVPAQVYLIYMGVVGGGALMLGGAWLYKV